MVGNSGRMSRVWRLRSGVLLRDWWGRGTGQGYRPIIFGHRMPRSNERIGMEPERACTAGVSIESMLESDLEALVALERDCGLSSRGVESYRMALSDPRSL